MAEVMDKTKVDKTEEKALSALLDKLNKAYAKKSKDKSGVPVIFKASDRLELLKPEFIPTGIDAVDQAFGGGIPKRLITTFWGPSNCGKSWLAMRIAASVTKAGGRVLLIDLEGTTNALHLFEKELGLDLDLVTIVPCVEYGDAVIDVIDSILYDADENTSRDLFDLVIVDSISNIVPKVNLDKLDKDGAEGGTKVGAHAKLMTDFTTRWYGRGYGRNGQTAILISQQRSAINTTGGKGPTHQATGGNSVQHNSKLMVKFGKQYVYKKVKEEGKNDPVNLKVGHTVKLEVERNAITAIQGRKAEYNIEYGKGLSDIEAIVAKAKLPEYGYIIGAKRGYSYILLPEYGDILVKNADINDVLIARTDIADLLRKTVSAGKPKELPTQSGNLVDLTHFADESFEGSVPDVEVE